MASSGSDIDNQTLAERCADFMSMHDRVGVSLDMKVKEIAPGAAVLTMNVRPDMVNGHNICHGAMIFALADTAFAYASNSRNKSTLAQHNSITYLSPAQLGETLTATAHEVSLTGRSGLYDVAVIGKDGRKVAEFRGHSRRIGDGFIEENQQT